MEPKKAPRVGLEPTTLRLTAECSTIELSRNIFYPAFQQVFFMLEGYTFKTAYTITSIHASTVFFRIIRSRFCFSFFHYFLSHPVVFGSSISASHAYRYTCIGSSISASLLSNDLHTKFLWRLRYKNKCSGQTLDRLVAVSSIHYCTSTSALSTSSSSRGLTTYVWDISS